MRASTLLFVFILLPLGALGVLACGATHATAPRPSPNVVAAREPGATFGVTTLAVPASICSQHADLKELCVDGLSEAMRAGLSDVLGRFFAPAAGESPTYSAEFRFQELRHRPEAGEVQLTMRWQFLLRDRLGYSPVELAETTVGPELMADGGPADQAVGALLNAVLERIGRAVAERKAARPAGTSACIAGATQMCVGPGGCEGAQFCIDGTRFSPCDCATKKP